jgi:site-specific DNA recombinase
MIPSQSAIPTRVACYARVSTEDQAERQTIASQTDFLRRYCDLHGMPVAGVYVDDGISGATALEERPEGRRLLQDAESGAFTVVLVYRLDRLGRSLKSLLAAHERLDAAGVAIRSGTEPFDTASPIGKFLFSLLGSMAELERSTIAERMSRGRDRVAAQGQYTGGLIPFGYDLDDARRLVPSTRIVPQLGITETELVRDIFSRVAHGEATVNAECDRLGALGIQNARRYGGKRGRVIERSGPWSYPTLQTMMHNPVYKGTGIIDSRYGQVERPAPALVDASTWDRVQVAMTRNRVFSRKNSTQEYHLRGLITCARCGRRYYGRVSAVSLQQRHRTDQCLPGPTLPRCDR